MSRSQQTISVRPGHVLVERPPDYEVVWSEERESILEIWEFCKKLRCSPNVLVVGARTKVSLSTLELFQLGEMIANLGLRVAVVELHDAPEEDVRFLKNVAISRGSPIKFFDNEREAKQWLGVQ